MPRYAVVGGGITGLVAARSLRRAGADVVLFEADRSLGGKIRTTRWSAGRIEEGADSFLARGAAILSLVRDLGLEDETVEPDIFGALVWTGRRLEPLPKDAVLGFPLSPFGAWRRGPLSLAGAARASLDLVRARRLHDAEVAVGAFVRDRFGDEVLELMVDPILAGTRAGDPERLSLAAALPSIHALALRSPSLIRALRAARRAGRAEAAPARFLSFRDGMARLVEALETDLERSGAELRTSTAVAALPNGGGGRIETDGGESSSFDGIVLALPAPAASSLVERVDARAATLLRSIRHASVAAVTLAFEARHEPRALDGSGILVPSRRGRVLSAATWFSRKWNGATTEGTFVARCFVGRAGTHPALALDDDALVDAVLRDLRAVAGIRGAPHAHLVARWDRGLPQYEIGHLARVAEAEALLAPQGIELAGASYRGSGLADCVAQGDAAARRLLGVP